MRVFELNINKLIVLLLPTLLRKQRMFAWIQCLLSPVERLHYNFLQKREQDLYNLTHNGQVCYLRGALNDRFDPELRRIIIMGSLRYGRKYIYTYGENKPQFLRKENDVKGEVIYLHDDSDYKDTGVDFLVGIPTEVWEREKTTIRIGEVRFYDMESLVDYYRLASKRYKIINN